MITTETLTKNLSTNPQEWLASKNHEEKDFKKFAKKKE